MYIAIYVDSAWMVFIFVYGISYDSLMKPL